MKILKLTAISVVLFSFSIISFASGTHNADSMKDSGYNKGKNIVYKQLLCDACPLKSVHLDKSVAKDIVMKLKQGDNSLGELRRAEVDSVVMYLSDRFSL